MGGGTAVAAKCPNLPHSVTESFNLANPRASEEHRDSLLLIRIVTWVSDCFELSMQAWAGSQDFKQGWRWSMEMVYGRSIPAGGQSTSPGELHILRIKHRTGDWVILVYLLRWTHVWSAGWADVILYQMLWGKERARLRNTLLRDRLLMLKAREVAHGCVAGSISHGFGVNMKAHKGPIRGHTWWE